MSGGRVMYATLYDRLTGWLYVIAGIAGLLVPAWSTYIRFSPAENVAHLALGLLAMAAARGRKRAATLMALLTGMTSLLWGIWGISWPTSILGTAEPLENAVHVVIGLWGLYVAVHDVSAWRRTVRS